MRKRIGTLALVAAIAALLAAHAAADVKLASVFGDHMVLQRDIAVPVWGTAEPGEQITVTLGDQKATAKANPKGEWRVKLKPMAAGGPLDLVVESVKPSAKKGDDALQLDDETRSTAKLTDVLVGDVWVCSGQSNMAMSVRGSANAQAETAAASFPKIRLFTVKHTVAQSPQTACEGAWSACSPATVGNFSAVGYFFGRDLHKKLGMPIGLIHTSWGGTPAEAWAERSFLEADPNSLPILARWLRVVEAYPEAQKRHQTQLAQWQEAVQKAKAEGKKPPRRPGGPPNPNHPHYPSGLYNAMVAPLVPYAIKGAIWYQGESNAGRAYQYRTLFPAMIQSWRKVWAQGDFPFLFVQLASFMGVEAEPKDAPWPELREAQSMTLALPNTGQAVIIDIGEARDIHPKNKQDVGGRLALAALKVAYGQDLVYSGPMVDSMTVEGNKARIKFQHVGGGLVAKPLADPVTPSGPTLAKRFGRDIAPGLRPPSDLLGFAIAGEDKKFHWAQAKIDGDAVLVWSDQVAKPVAVRYAWENNPVCNLYNQEGLPASPFRTDQWPGATINSR